MTYKSYEKSSAFNIRYALISTDGQLIGEYPENK